MLRKEGRRGQGEELLWLFQKPSPKNCICMTFARAGCRGHLQIKGLVEREVFFTGHVAMSVKTRILPLRVRG